MKFQFGPNTFTADNDATFWLLLGFTLLYSLAYWLALWALLLRKDFETNDRILWFLVITMAPCLGLITYWLVVPGRAAVPAQPKLTQQVDGSKTLDTP